MTILIKDYKVLRNLMEATWHKKMIALAMWCSSRYSQFCIVSSYREGDTGVHGTLPCRGLDMRSICFDDPKAVEDDINNHWEYDHTRQEMKCALYHDAGQGFHLHLQVHNSTRYHEGGRVQVKEVV